MIENQSSLLRLVHLIIRTWAIFISLSVLATNPAWADTENIVSLKADIHINSSLVTLGDIFSQAGEASHIVIADAPAPGQRLALKARSIAAFSYQHGLIWKNSARLETIFIHRTSHTITTRVILDAVSQALEAESSLDRLVVELRNRKLQMKVPVHLDDSLEVRELSFDMTSGHFEAILHAGGDDGESVNTHISGRAYEAFDVPTLNRARRAGEVIEAGDIEWKRIRQSRIGRTVITDETLLIGMSIKRQITPGQPLRKSDVERPVIIKKGAQITLVYLSPGITLTAAGRSLSDGGVGDVIRIVNTQSNRTVQARVSTAHKAIVADLSAQLSANQ